VTCQQQEERLPRHCEFSAKLALANFALSEAIQKATKKDWIASSLPFLEVEERRSSQ
jgi:hypothetical protein